MKRIFLRNNIIRGDQIILDAEESNHLMNALRHKTGDQIIVSDENEYEYITVISEYTDGKVFLKIKEKNPLSKKKLSVTLVQGLCKGEKMDLIVQKATELGITEIIPLETSRTVVRLEKNKAEKRVERWQRIALEAAKQCGTSKVPEVKNIVRLSDFLKNMGKDENYLLFWEEEKQTRLRNILDSLTGNAITLIIGPEGGFDEKEVVLLRERGALSVSLGERILRTETAGIAAMACVMYHHGDLG